MRLGRRVLVVDDEPAVTESIRAILTMADYDCAMTYSGAEALQLVPTFKPDLVISDVLMPDMTGLQLASELRNTNPYLPIVLLSGSAATQELLTQAGENVGPVLAKPYSPRELLRVVAALLATAQNAA
jgi:CheY-like chemotaxis protein